MLFSGMPPAGGPTAGIRFGWGPANDNKMDGASAAGNKPEADKFIRTKPGRAIMGKGDGFTTMTFRPVAPSGRQAVAKVLRKLIREKGLQDDYSVNERDPESIYKLILKVPGRKDVFEVLLPGTDKVIVLPDENDPLKEPESKFFKALENATTLTYKVIEGDNPDDPHADKWINDALIALIPATHE